MEIFIDHNFCVTFYIPVLLDGLFSAMIKYKSLFLLVHLYTVSLAINSPTGQGLLNQLGAAFGQSGTPTLPNDAKATA